MATPRSGKEPEGVSSGDDRRSEATAKRPGWQTGHLPRMPRDASDDEPDWVTGWFHERLLDGLFEERAEDQEHPKHGVSRSPRSAEGWTTGSLARRRRSAVSDDLADGEAECEDPPE
jgi:hypothetical protein